MFSKPALHVVVVAVATSAGAICFAGPAHAAQAPARPAQVWVQSFERSGPDALCVAPAGETPWNSAWTAADKTWKPSWELWANGGKGGWTCNRAITWDAGFTPYPEPT